MKSAPNATSANIFGPLTPATKQVYPTQTARKKRFAKIREQIEGKR